MEACSVRAYVDLDALAANVRNLKKMTGSRTLFMAVVKADGYGHGAIPTARTALANGADWLGVARPEEAIRLRESGIKAPILIFGSTPVENIPDLNLLDLVQTVSSHSYARMLSLRAEELGMPVRVHLKVDSGMGRLGFYIPPSKEKADMEKVLSQIRSVSKMKGLKIEGISTHFATADDEDLTFARRQFSCFQELTGKLEKDGIRFAIRHAANSAALIGMPETHLDMVRPGISLYGLYPSPAVSKDLVPLTPAMTLKAPIIQVKRVSAGTTISYGRTCRISEETFIATVPVGYGDGYSRLLSNKGSMLVKGKRAPIAGRVCMDLTMLDVGRIPGVEIGDEAVIMGRQGNDEISADEIAENIETINYEIVSSLTERVKIIYLRKNPKDCRL